MQALNMYAIKTVCSLVIGFSSNTTPFCNPNPTLLWKFFGLSSFGFSLCVARDERHVCWTSVCPAYVTAGRERKPCFKDSVRSKRMPHDGVMDLGPGGAVEPWP